MSLVALATDSHLYLSVRRGEKLYVTMDKRSKRGCGRCFCWGLCLAVLVAAVVIGILAASEYTLVTLSSLQQTIRTNKQIMCIFLIYI